MTRRIQVLLGNKTYRLLERMSIARSQNKSAVLHNAILRLAERAAVESALGKSLGRRRAGKAMETGIKARQEGRLVPHRDVARKTRSPNRNLTAAPSSPLSPHGRGSYRSLRARRAKQSPLTQ